MLYKEIESIVNQKLETDNLNLTVTEVELTPDNIVVELKDEAGAKYELLMAVSEDNTVTIEGEFTPVVETKADESEAKTTPDDSKSKISEAKADEEMATKLANCLAKSEKMMSKQEEMMSKMIETCSKIDAYNLAQNEAEAKQAAKKDVEAKAKTTHWLNSITND